MNRFSQILASRKIRFRFSHNSLSTSAPPPQSKIEAEFESATTISGMIEAFQAMESSKFYNENHPNLGLACLRIGLLIQQGNNSNSNEALNFGENAVKIFFKVDRWSISMSKSYYLVASACYSLGRLDECLQHLEKAENHLGKIEKKGADPSDIRVVLCDVLYLLWKTHEAIGAKVDGLVYYRRFFEIKDFSPPELGVANKELAEQCVSVLEFQEALPYGKTALEIRQAIFGDKSVEVAHDRCLLAHIYLGLGIHDKALEEFQQSQEIYNTLGLPTESIRVEIDKSKIYISLKKFDKAVNLLEAVLQKLDDDSELRALVYLVMAKSLCELKNFSNAKDWLEISCRIFDTKENEIPVEVAESYIEASILYETLAEFEKSVSVLKRALDILQNFPQEQYLKGTASTRLGGLLLNTGKVEESILYLENGAMSMVKSLGSNHPRVRICFTHLGAAYEKIHRPQCAKQMFQIAEDIKNRV